MISIINRPAQRKPEPWKFPLLLERIEEEPPVIVLATGTRGGLFSGTQLTGNNIGMFHHNWPIEEFEPFIGEVTLGNDKP